MQSTYPTQHCGCDFCSSRRAVNAKKLAVSQAAAAASQRGGCNCACHDNSTKQNGSGVRGFDPDYPEPVNQTALNASRGRTGVPGGNQHTIKNGSSRKGENKSTQGGNTTADNGKETAEQREARETAELDALERLLIAEYKARTRATMEAERLRALSGSTATARHPQPLPEDYAADNHTNAGGYRESGTWGRDGPAGSGGSYGKSAATIHEAYAMAQACPVTPPAQCHASHRLQDTMDDVRKVTGDPVNPTNRRALQRLLQKNGLGSDGDGDGDGAGSDASSARAGSANNANKAGENTFGSSLAQIRTSNAHPRGAGVVWASAGPRPNSAQDANVLTLEPARSGSAKQPPPLSPGAAAAAAAAQQPAGERHVTYAA